MTPSVQPKPGLTALYGVFSATAAGSGSRKSQMCTVLMKVRISLHAAMPPCVTGGALPSSRRLCV